MFKINLFSIPRVYFSKSLQTLFVLIAALHVQNKNQNCTKVSEIQKLSNFNMELQQFVAPPVTKLELKLK